MCYVQAMRFMLIPFGVASYTGVVGQAGFSFFPTDGMVVLSGVLSAIGFGLLGYCFHRKFVDKTCVQDDGRSDLESSRLSSISSVLELATLSPAIVPVIDTGLDSHLRLAGGDPDFHKEDLS